MKKVKIAVALVLWVLSSYVYVQDFQFLENLNNKFTDIFFELRGTEKPSEDIVIVDVDESSLKLMKGFSREKLAHIIDNLRQVKVAIVGLDMVFPQSDQKSPKTVLSHLGLDAQNVKDYDNILSNSFKKTLLISGYTFDFSSSSIRGKIPNISSIIIQSNFSKHEYIPQAKGITSNIALLQDSSYSSGFFNMIADEDGITRSFPLVIRYKDTLYPSLPLELAREYLKKRKIIIDYSSAGINSINLDNYTIPTDRFGRLVIDFKGTSKSYRYISAHKIYDNSFNKDDIKGKIVLISSSVSRFRDIRATPFDSTIESVEIQANIIDNIISNNFLSKPNFIEIFDMALLFIILMLLVIFSLYGAIRNTLFFVVLMGGFFLFAFLLFSEFGLILNIFFPITASFILYSILTSLHYIFEVKQKEKLNSQLVLELKDREEIIKEEVKQKTKELKKVAEEKTVLLRELHHRVKNNLQLILSITRLQQHSIKDKTVQEELNKLQDRIKAIAKTHEILCGSEDIDNVDMGEYIGELCEEMENSILEENIEIDLNIKSTSLPLRQAVYLGLVINELMSNSIKYAFDNKDGKISISLVKNDEEYVLKIGDSGVGYDNSLMQNNSLGLKLVDALVIDQLDGTIEVKNENNFEYIIRFKACDET